MFAWFAQNWPTVLICIGLIAVVTLIIVSMIRDKKAGKSSCGNSCASCPMGGKCHEKK
ncbi:MAG: FeoB-associated Cys-rich membrane protein [Clostridia bacterium]|nr:FeoB-associated Cys-rich membrane protein [Clostridia bacterium]